MAGLEAFQTKFLFLLSESEIEERKFCLTFKCDGVTFSFERGFYILKEGNKMAEQNGAKGRKQNGGKQNGRKQNRGKQNGAIFPPFFTFSSVRARPLNGQQLYVEIFSD